MSQRTDGSHRGCPSPALSGARRLTKPSGFTKSTPGHRERCRKLPPPQWEPGSELKPGWQEPTCARQLENCNCKSSAPLSATVGKQITRLFASRVTSCAEGRAEGCGARPSPYPTAGVTKPQHHAAARALGEELSPTPPRQNRVPAGPLTLPAEILAPRERLLGLQAAIGCLVFKRKDCCEGGVLRKSTAWR